MTTKPKPYFADDLSIQCKRICTAMAALGFPAPIEHHRWAPELAKIADALETILERGKNPCVWAVMQRMHDEQQKIDVIHMHMLFNKEQLAKDYAHSLAEDGPPEIEIFVEKLDVVTEVTK